MKDFQSFLSGAEPVAHSVAPAASFSLPPSFLSQAAPERRSQSRRNFAAEAYLDVIELAEEALRKLEAPERDPLDPEPPGTDPDSIAAELALSACLVERDIDLVRRAFAKRSHPDLVPESHRAAAMIRMQIANRLIDDAKAAMRGRAA